jgi:hypothetical protein
MGHSPERARGDTSSSAGSSTEPPPAAHTAERARPQCTRHPSTAAACTATYPCTKHAHAAGHRCATIVGRGSIGFRVFSETPARSTAPQEPLQTEGASGPCREKPEKAHSCKHGPDIPLSPQVIAISKRNLTDSDAEHDSNELMLRENDCASRKESVRETRLVR